MGLVELKDECDRLVAENEKLRALINDKNLKLTLTIPPLRINWKSNFVWNSKEEPNEKT